MKSETTKKSRMLKSLSIILITGLGTLLLNKLFTDDSLKIAGEIDTELRDEIISDGFGDSTQFRVVKGKSPISAPAFNIDMAVICEILKDIRGYSIKTTGLRFYPSYSGADTNLHYIIGVESESGTLYKDEAFLILDKDWNSAPTYYSAKNVVEHIKGFRNLIEYNSDLNPDDTITLSRFYSVDEIISYFRRNNIKFDNPTTYNDLILTVSGGFIDGESLKVINNYYRNSIPEDCDSLGRCELGFTVLLSLKEKGSKDIGLSFEIGNPCPPRCGFLHDYIK